MGLTIGGKEERCLGLSVKPVGVKGISPSWLFWQLRPPQRFSMSNGIGVLACACGQV